MASYVTKIGAAWLRVEPILADGPVCRVSESVVAQEAQNERTTHPSSVPQGGLP